MIYCLAEVIDMIITYFDDNVVVQSGKDIENGIVYCSFRNNTACYARRYVKPRTTEHNKLCGAKFKRANLLYKSIPEAFKESLWIYAHAYNRQIKPRDVANLSGFNIFVKALCRGLVALDDLDSISRFTSLYGRTVSDWMECGLLERVKGKMSDAEVTPDIIEPIVRDHFVECERALAEQIIYHVAIMSLFEQHLTCLRLTYVWRNVVFRYLIFGDLAPPRWHLSRINATDSRL